MTSPRTRVALAAAAVAALGVGALLGLRPADREPQDAAERSGRRPSDEMPADSAAPASSPATAPSERRAAPLAAGGRASRPSPSTPAAGTPVPTPIASPATAATADTTPAARAWPSAPGRPADGVAGVLFDGEGKGVAGAVLRMRRGAWADRVIWSKPMTDSEITVAVEGDGRFLRRGLSEGEWWAEVVVPGLLPRLVGFTVGKAGEGAAIPMGDGVVAGRLYDREGKAVVGARVTASRGPSEGFPVLLEVVTTDDGSFRFDGLAAGPWWLTGFLDRADPSVNRTEQIWITSGSTLAHDLGIPRPEPRWSGVVRTRTGKPVRGGGGAAVFLIEKASTRAHAAKFDEEGRFSERFPAGLHSLSVVYLGGVERKPILLGEIGLDGDLERDVTLPGSRLSGTIRSSAAGGVPSGQRLYWTPDGKDHLARDAISVAADGGYVVDATPAGRYRITGFPLALFDARGDPPVVDMSDDRPEVTLDLVAKPP